MSALEASLGHPRPVSVPPTVGSESASRYEALLSATQKILQERNLSGVLHAICEEARKTLSADWSAVSRLSVENTRTHAVVCSNNMPAEKERENLIRNLIRDLGDRVKELLCMHGVLSSIQRCKTVQDIFQEVANLMPSGWRFTEITRVRIRFDEKDYVSDLFEETEWKQSSEIIIRDKQMGLVEVFYTEKRPNVDEGPFLLEERRLLDSIARTLSEAIQRIQADEARVTHANRLEKLYDLSQRNSGSLNIDEVLTFIVGTAAELLNLQHVNIWLAEDGVLLLRASHVPWLWGRSNVRIRIGKGGVGRVVKMGATLYIRDVLKDPEWIYKRWSRHLAIRSFLGIPLKIEDHVIGVLSFMAVGIREFQEEELTLISTLANSAAIAIHNAQLHEEAHRSREFFRSIVADSADPIMVVDERDRLVVWNAAAERLYGHTNSEIIGRDPKDFIVPRERQFRRQKTIAAVSQGISVHYETERMRKDGTRILIDSTVSPVKNRHGRIIARTAIHRDLTEQKTAERQLRTAHEKLQSLTNHLQAAREEERASMARELHDELGQRLARINYDLSWTENKLSNFEKIPRVSQLLERLHSARYLLDESMKRTHELVSGLRPGALDALGLVGGLRSYVNEFRARTGIHCRFLARPAAVPVTKDQSIGLFRIAQEALANVERHSKASSVKIELLARKEDITLQIEDSGKGIQACEISSHKSFGILGMTERAHILGGQLKIDSAASGGTRVHVQIPWVRPYGGERETDHRG